jgi:putative transposase
MKKDDWKDIDSGARGRAPSRDARFLSGGTAAPPSDTPLPKRHHPAHLPNIERHNEPVIIFVTVCSKNRRCTLASERVHDALLSAWSHAKQYIVGRYVIMPDHVHLFCSPIFLHVESVARWCGYWKRLVSVDLNEVGGIWQRDCWDTQLRRGDHYGEKWEYVQQNPVRRGLVVRTEDWPYQGVLNELRW